VQETYHFDIAAAITFFEKQEAVFKYPKEDEAMISFRNIHAQISF
jgi:hypothetical protein